MGVLTAVLYTIVVIISLLLIGLVLIQPSKGGGFGAAFGGVGENVFGAQALSHLSRLTIVLMSVFFALTLLLAVLAGHRQKAKSLVETETAEITPAAAKAQPEAAKEVSKPIAAEKAETAELPAPAPAKPEAAPAKTVEAPAPAPAKPEAAKTTEKPLPPQPAKGN